MGSESENVIAAFTIDQTARLTGVSRRQLGTWNRDGFFSPSLVGGGRGAYSRLFSFNDLLSLRVLHQLRNETQVPLDHLREVKAELSHLGDDMWAKSTLYVKGKRVVIKRDDDTRYEAGSGQEVFQIPLRIVVGNMRDRIRNLNVRDDSEIGRIEQKRGVVHSQAVIAGTRVSVSTIKEFAEAGYTIPQILNEYPSLSKADVEAALAFRDKRDAA